MARRTETILVTGISGLIGGLVARDLAADYNVRGLSRRAVNGFSCIQADVCDLAAITPAFDGIDTVVHMAAYLGSDAESQIAVNVSGTYHVFEAAREAGVRRVVFASSGATVSGYERDEPIKAMVEGRTTEVAEPRPVVTVADPVRPVGLYGAVKVLGEALGRHYADAYGMSVICIRIGRVTADDRPVDARHAAVFLSTADVTRAVRRSVEAPPEVGFAVFFAVSNNRCRYRDLEGARTAVGFEPQDSAEALS